MALSRGPAAIKWRGLTLFSEGDITLEIEPQEGQVESSAYGRLFDFTRDFTPRLNCTLVGQINNDHFALIYNEYATLLPGKSIFGNSADRSLEICPLDTTQEKTVFHSAALTDMPNLRLSDEGIIYGGAAQWGFVRGNNRPPTDPEAFFHKAANDFDGGGMNVDQVKVQSYRASWMSDGGFKIRIDEGAGNVTSELDWDVSAAALQTAINNLTNANDVTVTGNVFDGWEITTDADNESNDYEAEDLVGLPPGTTAQFEEIQEADTDQQQIVILTLTPWANFPGQSGAQVQFGLETEEQRADGVGVYDLVFQGVTAECNIVPVNVPSGPYIDAARIQGPLALPGRRTADGAHDLIIRGEGLYVALYRSNLSRPTLNWGRTTPRVGETVFRSSRTVTGGVLDPLFFVGTSEPA